MNCILAFAALIGGLDAQNYRDRERATLAVFRSTFPARYAVLRAVEQIGPPEMADRSRRVAALWFGDQIKADARAILDAVRRPKPWRYCDQIEKLRAADGRYDPWARGVWAIIGPELHKLYPAEWIAWFEVEMETITVGALSSVLLDLHRHLTGSDEW